MHETEEDLRSLQQLLDESYAGAGSHLRSIFTPERRMSAEDVVRTLRGIFVLHLATVTASGAPRVAPIDGLFHRGRIWFSVPHAAVRIAHLRRRPDVSAAYTKGKDVCIIAHGNARQAPESDRSYRDFETYGREVYGGLWENRDHQGLTAWIDAERMYATGTRQDAVPA